MVDHRVGFFRDGGPSVWTCESTPPNGPLTVSRAGSLLRRTWRGMSEKEEGDASSQLNSGERHYSKISPALPAQ